MKITSVFLLLFCVFFMGACDHSTIDPENNIRNLTSEEIFVKEYSAGVLEKNRNFPSNTANWFCTCGEVLTSDSLIIQTVSGDSIVYHHPRITNSNFEPTKARSPFSEENWEAIRENAFEYKVLPEDFQ